MRTFVTALENGYLTIRRPDIAFFKLTSLYNTIIMTTKNKLNYI